MTRYLWGIDFRLLTFRILDSASYIPSGCQITPARMTSSGAVSYTHLDVYKRQGH
ncbi:hypothetical protein [Erwinia amylovora]